MSDMTNDLNKWATWREIHAQPDIWAGWGRDFDPAPLRDWVGDADEVWFTGAGTSAYIGDIIVAGLEGQPGPRLRSVPTTDLVARPHAYLSGKNPLVVSFGRSGNSSETIGTLDALDALTPDAKRLNITCNGGSALAERGGANGRVVVLPEATHDAGFAMTSSFSTMVLTALGIFSDAGDWTDRMGALGAQMRDVLGAAVDLVGPRPDRCVFLGTGAMTFAARESALKVMELTAGQMPCLWDSVLGFRHGPKSFVTDATRVVVLTSADDMRASYEADLIAEMRAQFPRVQITVIGPSGDLDLTQPYGPLWAAPLAVAFSQIAGVIWSDDLGLNVDDPFAGQGTLSRVVSGVTLYPVVP